MAYGSYLLSCHAHVTGKAIYIWLAFLATLSSFPVQALAITCAELDGAYVYSQESTPVYLGFFGSQFASESIMNEFGTYGSQFQSLSVRNQFGTYGSSFGSYSANSDYTSTPPRIYKYGIPIASLTTNSSISGGVSLSAIDSSCTFSASSPSVNPPPSPPSWINASDGTYTDKIQLTWASVTGATSYNVYYAEYSTGTKYFVNSTTSTTMNITGATAYWNYYFWVSSSNASGEGILSNPDSGYMAQAPTTYTLIVNKTGTGAGTVGGTGTYTSGTTQAVTATASTGSTFTGWSGDCSGATSPLDVLMNGDKACTATFTLNQYSLAVNKTGTGAGTVGGAGTYGYGTTQLVTATANTGSTFTGWSGDCSGATSPLDVVVDANKTCTATFALNQYTLTVNTAGTGAGSVGGAGTYDYGTSQPITATAGTDSIFTGWSGDCSGTISPTSVLMNGNKTCIAIFSVARTLTVNKIGTGAGTVGGGGTYIYGATQPITATAGTDSIFTGWSGDCSGTDSPLNVVVDANKTCTATFTLARTLIVNKTGTGVGSVGGGGTYIYGTTQPITAIAGTESVFTGWSGDCSGTDSPLDVVVDANKTCTATFTLNQYTLAVNKTGTGAGAVGGAGTYGYGTTQPVTATASTGSTFTGWSGDCSGSTNPLSLLIDSNKTCTATFTLNQYALTVNTVGTGVGTVGGAGTYDYGTSQPVTATAGTKSTFTGWSGDCSGVTSPLGVLIDGNKTCTATFTLITLTVNKKGAGTVTSVPAGIDCGANCSESYEPATEITLTAVPAKGGTFVGWSGEGCTGTEKCVVIMDDQKEVYAVFKNNFPWTMFLPAITKGIQ